MVWCAKHRYPYVALATFLEPTVELWDIYRDAAAEEGYQVGPENFGYLQKVYVAETEEKAHEIAKWDMFGGAGIGYSLFGQPQWMFPPGYNSKEATKRVARQFTDPASTKGSPWAGVAAGHVTEKISDAQIKTRSACVAAETGRHRRDAANRFSIAFPAVERSMQVICGTPKTRVSRSCAKCWKCCGQESLPSGRMTAPISKEDRLNNIRLIATEVMPAMRQIGEELGLNSPFEVNPGHARCRQGRNRFRWDRSRRCMLVLERDRTRLSLNE